jgi:hypothetical protein
MPDFAFGSRRTTSVPERNFLNKSTKRSNATTSCYWYFRSQHQERLGGTELLKARDRERSEGGAILFPVRIVPFEAVKAWRLFDADAGRDLAREVREYFIPDFCDWRDDDAFLKRAHELVAALMKDEHRRRVDDPAHYKLLVSDPY